MLELNGVEEDDDLVAKAFDLGERGGGPQTIVAYKRINSTQFYVITLGNGPRSVEDSDVLENEIKNEGSVEHDKKIQELENRLINSDDDDIKIRVFKLTLQENNKYLVEEYVTPEGVINVAKIILGDEYL